MSRFAVASMRLVYAVLLGLASSRVASAQPIVANVTVAGGSLTITGSAFGEHPKYGGTQPFLNAGWHDFEDGSFAGGNIERETGHAANWSMDSIGNRPNSRYSITKTNAVSRLGEVGLRENIGGMAGMKGALYVSFWMRVSGINAAGKFFRVYGDAFDVFLATGDSDLFVRAFSSCGSDSRSHCAPVPSTVWGSPSRFTPGNWHRIDVFMRDASLGNADYMAVYLDGKLQWRRGSALPSKATPLEGSSANERQQWIPTPFGGNGHTVGIGQMIEGGGKYNFDDLFIDYSWSHVELANAPTYAASTIRETQIPVRWSGHEIVATINRGAFQPGQTVYAYVIDGEGIANAKGYPLKLDASGRATR